jgi:hypothetical protein
MEKTVDIHSTRKRSVIYTYDGMVMTVIFAFSRNFANIGLIIDVEYLGNGASD